jgi:hypothetical protein
LLFVGLAVLVSGALFEVVDEPHQVTGILETFGNKMEMVGHKTKGVEGKRMARRERGELGKDLLAQGNVRENRVAFRAADRNEV